MQRHHVAASSDVCFSVRRHAQASFLKCHVHCSCSQPEYTAFTIAGPPDSSAEELWVKLKEHPDVLAAAPDDEVLAELLATQVDSQTCVQRRVCSTLTSDNATLQLLVAQGGHSALQGFT